MKEQHNEAGRGPSTSRERLGRWLKLKSMLKILVMV
jgi:hypothetical protein